MERLAPHMSYQDWKETGPVNRPSRDGEIYDGFQSERNEEPYWARIKAGVMGTYLSNPNHQWNVSPFTAAHGQYFHFMMKLDQGGKDALNLTRDAAKRGNDVTEDALRIGGHPNAWAMVSPFKETSKVLRSFVETALEFYPPAKGVLRQELPKSEKDLDLPAFAASFQKRAMPPRWRTWVLEGPGLRLEGQGDEAPLYHTPSGEKMTKEAAEKRLAENNAKRGISNPRKVEPRKFSGVIALFADSGMSDAARDWTGRLPKNLIVAPMGGEVSKELSKIQRRTQMMANKGNKNEHGKQIPLTDQVLGNADAAAVFWNGDHRSKGAEMVAAAARYGILAKVLDHDGKELPLFESARICMEAHMSAKEAARAKSLDAFNLSASEPYGRMGLKMISDGKKGRLDDKDIDRIAKMDESINDIADMAKTNREYLFKEHRISARAMDLLSDDKVMANARESFLRQHRHLSDNGVTVLGKEGMPQALLQSGQAPTELYLQGDPESFKALTGTVGIVGDGAATAKGPDDVGARLAASQIVPATLAIATSPAVLIHAEGATSTPVPINAPQVLVLGSGHGHANTQEELEQRQAVLDSGGWVVSPYPPEEVRSFYDVKARERVGIESKSNDNTTNRAAALVGAMSDRVFITDIDRSRTTSPAHSAMRAALDVASGGPRRPAVVNANQLDTVPSLAGNRALTNSRGAAALTKAGFGSDVVERHKDEFDGSKVALDLGRDVKKGVSNLMRRMRGEKLDLPAPAKTREQEAR